MQITQIDLENVKSYQRASIPFTEGTNAICGPNGAGKSTLLESIGFALFDMLSCSQGQFIREGEKTATVTIHLTGEDGRVYHVVRKCGSSNQYYVYDPEIDQKLTTSKNETVDWLYDLLGVEESSDLSVLFKDAVGVPQGLLTAAFLLAPGRRKDTFNPLLRVDEYEKAWEALRESQSRLKDWIADKAHNFAPTAADLVSSQVLKTILSEGRKFGVAVGLISQRPGKLDADVLSQCMTQFILRIVNPVDQARVAESVESVGRDLLKELPALSKGQAIVAGAAVNTPVVCRVRRRITEHGAEDVDAPASWLAWFAEDMAGRRDRDRALPAEPKARGRRKLFKT
jgi:energy-coupling factor transporter ATP-binding protein EcfA2